MMKAIVFIQEDDFDPGSLQESLKNKVGARTGGIVSFTGYVRDYSLRMSTKTLFLDHYPGMCERELGIIVETACKNWNLEAAIAVHRIGKLERNERIVFVSAAGVHRKEAFLGCAYIIDMIKSRIPIWKCEILENGEKFWVNSTESDHLLTNF